MTRKQTEQQLAAIAKELQPAVGIVEDCAERLRAMADEQRECFDNMPESLQQSENGQTSEVRADRLSALADWLENIKDAFEEEDVESID